MASPAPVGSLMGVRMAEMCPVVSEVAYTTPYSASVTSAIRTPWLTSARAASRSGIPVGGFERKTGQDTGFLAVGRHQVEFGQELHQPFCQRRGGRVGANWDLCAPGQADRRAQALDRQVGIHKDHAGGFEERFLFLQILRRERFQQAHIVDRVLQFSTFIDDTHIGTGRVFVRAQDSRHLHPGSGGVCEDFVSGAVVPQDGDQAHGLSQARQVLGHVAGHAPIRTADARRVGGRRPQFRFEATNHVHPGCAKDKDGLSASMEGKLSFMPELYQNFQFVCKKDSIVRF